MIAIGMHKVLVVEDSSSMRALVRAMLEDAEFADAHGGVEVSEASSGFDAMRLLPRGRFALVVTDINMPDINGLELVRFVREKSSRKQTPLIIVSTDGRERDRERGLKLGANHYLTKPFTPEQLQEAVSNHLGLQTA